MHIRRIRSRFLLIALMLISSSAVFFPVRLTAAQGTNLLQNPGFEGTYTPFNNDPLRLVAPGWSPWNVAKKAGDPGFFLPPQFRAAENQGRIRNQPAAQELFEFFASFSGGVFQRVNVNPGAQLKFSAFVNIWSTSSDDPSQSEEPSRVTIEVGIDPNGNTNGESNDIVWSTPASAVYDEYREVSVNTTAQASFVTVFVKVSLPDPVQHNHAYIDDASLTIAGAAGDTPTAAPPTATATVVAQLPTSTNTLPPVVTLPPTNTLDPNIPTREGNTPTPSFTPGGPTVTPGPIITIPPTATRVAFATITPTLLIFGTVAPDLDERIFVTVQPGDTVIGLAARYGSTVEAIVNANGLANPGLISIGQQLLIPVANLPSGTPTNTPVRGSGQQPTAVPPTARPGTALPGTPVPPVLTANLTGPTVNGIGTYIVQPGDTFEAIARRYNVAPEALARLNGILNPRLIVIGQVLAVPGPGNNTPGGTRAPTIIPTVPGSTGTRTHVIQPGDTLFRIAARYNVPVDAIMRLNNIVNPNLIFAGQVLRIP